MVQKEHSGFSLFEGAGSLEGDDGLFPSQETIAGPFCSG